MLSTFTGIHMKLIITFNLLINLSIEINSNKYML